MQHNWIKRLILTWAIALSILFLVPLMPWTFHRVELSWWIPTAQANWFRTFVRRLGPGPQASEQVSNERNYAGAARGPICIVRLGEEVAPTIRAISIAALTPATERRVDDTGRSIRPEVSLDDELTFSAGEAIVENIGGLTVSEKPTFWFYIPFIASEQARTKVGAVAAPVENIRVGKFVLLDEGKRLVSSHLMAIALADRPQLVPFKLPFPLEVGKTYGWHFSIICEPEKPSRNPVVRGWVQRVEPTPELTTAVESAQPTQRHLAYAENGIWFETVTELIETRRRFPKLYQPFQDWEDMLAYFELIDSQPIDFADTEPVAVKADPRRQSQLPARM